MGRILYLKYISMKTFCATILCLGCCYKIPTSFGDFAVGRVADGLTHVTALNFVRAETNDIMRSIFEDEMLPNGVGMNEFLHYRKKADSNLLIVRPNADTLYSVGLIDTAVGPVQITLPPVEDRYMSIICTDEEHYVEFYSRAPAVFRLQRETVESRYIFCIIRTALKRNDYELAAAIQNRVTVKVSSQAAYTGSGQDLALPHYDPVSLGENRHELRLLFNQLEDSRKMFGERIHTDDVAHLLGVAGGFGGLPENLAYYTNEVVEVNDGTHEYVLHFRDVPVNAFWSVTVYNEDGHLLDSAKVHMNSYQARPNADGSYTIHFSNDDSRINNIHIADKWNYCVRMYEPQQPIIDGNWNFPKAQKL